MFGMLAFGRVPRPSRQSPARRARKFKFCPRNHRYRYFRSQCCGSFVSCSPSNGLSLNPAKDRAEVTVELGIDFAAILTRTQHDLLDQGPNGFCRFRSILSAIQRFDLAFS